MRDFHNEVSKISHPYEEKEMCLPKLLTKALSLLAVGGIILTACAQAAPMAAPATTATSMKVDWSTIESAAAGGGMEALIAAAKAEGKLNVIALPNDWCNYGEAISTFTAKYGIKVNSITPEAGSADEIQAIRDNKENKGPQAPDVIDVGPAYGPLAKDEGLLAPY